MPNIFQNFLELLISYSQSIGEIFTLIYYLACNDVPISLISKKKAEKYVFAIFLEKCSPFRRYSSAPVRVTKNFMNLIIFVEI